MFYLLITGNAVIILTFLLKFSRLPPQLPLFYSKPWGEEQLADSWMLVILPLLMNGFYFLNTFLVKKFFKEDEFAKKIFHYLNIFTITALTLIFVRIIFLIT